NARPYFRYDEYQSPIVLGGYHREWQPGVHTLLLAGRLENDQRFSDRGTLQIIVDYSSNTNLYYDSDNLDIQHGTKLDIYTGEGQQIIENDRHALVVGVRWQ